jgi:class 3 adenylate cyclase
MVDQPSDTVTFVFTDLERSTPLWEQHPDEMRSALARHDELLATTESTVARSGAQTALLWDPRPD